MKLDAWWTKSEVTSYNHLSMYFIDQWIRFLHLRHLAVWWKIFFSNGKCKIGSLLLNRKGCWELSFQYFSDLLQKSVGCFALSDTSWFNSSFNFSVILLLLKLHHFSAYNNFYSLCRLASFTPHHISCLKRSTPFFFPSLCVSFL